MPRITTGTRSRPAACSTELRRGARSGWRRPRARAIARPPRSPTPPKALPQTEFTRELTETHRRDYTSGRSVPDAFGRWLERLLGPLGLVVFDASDPAAKPFATSLFRAEIENAGRTTRLAIEAGARLAEGGYHAQVTPSESSVALFALDTVRHPIKVAGDNLTIGDEVVSRAALAARASAEPQAFSPNVLLRPLVQDTIFPTVCYIAGPNELAYHAQLRSVYESFGLPMPLIHPRATATILDSAAIRVLKRYRVPFEDLERALLVAGRRRSDRGSRRTLSLLARRRPRSRPLEPFR